MQYKFLSPVQKVNGEKLEEIELKESFTGRDVRAIGNAGGEGSATIALVSAATGLSENTVLGMDARDVAVIANMAKPFLVGGGVSG